MKIWVSGALTVALVVGMPVLSSAQSVTQRAVADTQSLSRGVVKEVDASQGEITLDHGPLANLQMPGMTMVFRVVDGKLLSGVKAGDIVSFKAEKANGDIIVTQLEKAQNTLGAKVAPAPAQASAPRLTATSTRTASSIGALSTGTVKKIDLERGKITVSHGPLANLDMPAMTMVFAVANRALIGNVKLGDSIEFAAERLNGALTITQLVPGKASSAFDQPRVSQSSGTVPPASNAPSAVMPTGESVSEQAGKATSLTTPQLGAPGDPLDATIGIPASTYQSAFSNYQPMQELAASPEKVWRAANDDVAQLGGHVGQLREGSDNATGAMTGKPGDAMPANAPAGHDMTQMKKDK